MADHIYDVTNANSGSEIQYSISELFPRDLITCFINILYTLVFGTFRVKTKGLSIFLLRNKVEKTFK